jgi:RNA recognition motif-containing protein
LFIGNLSFFCEECHLFDLFDEYAHVNGVRIVRNDNRTRSLMFGFVTLSTVHEAKEMERMLNGSFFMGRRLKVAISDRRNEHGTGGRTPINEHENNGVQVHVAFSSFFPEDKILRPTEGWLRKTFTKYGVLLDCCVKEYQQYKESNMQEGYGFIAFHSYEDAVKVTNVCQNLNVQGITLTCSMSHLLHPGNKKNGQTGNMGQQPNGHMLSGSNTPQYNTRGGHHSGNMNMNNRSFNQNPGPGLQSTSMPPAPSSVSNNNTGNNPSMMEGGYSPYHPHPSMVYASQGVSMPMQFVPAPNAMMDHAPSMDRFTAPPPPGYYPAPHSSASVASASTNGSGSMAGPMNPPQMSNGGPPQMGMYPMPMYGLAIPYNQPMLNNNDKSRKMSPTYSTSSYGSGPY